MIDSPHTIAIRSDDLSGPEIRQLLEEHLRSMYEISPPESVHALSIDELRRPDVTFWSAWSGGELLGCGALRELSPTHGEVKSMRTVTRHLRKGVARVILDHIISEARRRSYAGLSLETGSMKEFDPARRLYEKFGFMYCPPFGDYVEDPNSVFMTLMLQPTEGTVVVG
jgi:putative acetyltransferase